EPSSRLHLWVDRRKNSFPCNRAPWPRVPDCFFQVCAFSYLNPFVVLNVEGLYPTFARLSHAVLPHLLRDCSKLRTGRNVEFNVKTRTCKSPGFMPVFQSPSHRVTSPHPKKSASRRPLLAWKNCRATSARWP